MAALTTERLTPRLGDGVHATLWAIPMKAATKVYEGGLVVVDAGYAAPGRAAVGLVAAGIARATVDNTGGGAGAIIVEVRRGVFKFANSAAGDLITQAHVGTNCYIVDDQTVAHTDGGAARSVAGRVLQLDADGGVFVEIV